MLTFQWRRAQTRSVLENWWISREIFKISDDFKNLNVDSRERPHLQNSGTRAPSSFIFLLPTIVGFANKIEASISIKISSCSYLETRFHLIENIHIK
jgi:hypothetical protein